MPNKLPELPNPMEVVDAAGDIVMEVPKLPARLAEGLGSAVSGMGANMEGAVRKVTDTPDDMPPDPITLVGGAVNYVLAIPRGVFSAVGSIVNTVGNTFGEIQSRIDRLIR